MTPIRFSPDLEQRQLFLQENSLPQFASGRGGPAAKDASPLSKLTTSTLGFPPVDTPVGAMYGKHQRCHGNPGQRNHADACPNSPSEGQLSNGIDDIFLVSSVWCAEGGLK